MAAANRVASFLATMVWEGGDKLSRDPRDPGNWSGGGIGTGECLGAQWGVSASVALKNGLKPGAITADEALRLFVEAYWLPIKADSLPAGLDHSASDDAYNAGPAGALRRIAKAQSAQLSVAGRIHAYAALRLAFLETLRSWRVFRVGWARRVAGVEAESLKMAIAAARGDDKVAPLRSPDALAFLTPADMRAPPIEKITPESIARAAAAAHEASRNSRAVAIAAAPAAGAWAALASQCDAPAWTIFAIVAGAAFVIASQVWTWLAHGARRDALDDLVAELSRSAAD